MKLSSISQTREGARDCYRSAGRPQAFICTEGLKKVSLTMRKRGGEGQGRKLSLEVEGPELLSSQWEDASPRSC